METESKDVFHVWSAYMNKNLKWIPSLVVSEEFIYEPRANWFWSCLKNRLFICDWCSSQTLKWVLVHTCAPTYIYVHKSESPDRLQRTVGFWWANQACKFHIYVPGRFAKAHSTDRPFLSDLWTWCPSGVYCDHCSETVGSDPNFYLLKYTGWVLHHRVVCLCNQT